MVVFLAARLVLSITAVAGSGALSESPLWRRYAFSPEEERAVPGLHNAIDGTFRWDAAWFARIAQEGHYRENDSSAAFYPVFPFVTRAVGLATGMSMLTAGMVVSNIAFIGSLVVLHALTRLERSESVARRTVILIAFFPTSFYFLAPYSESVFLFFTLLSFWLARRNRWVAGGLSGALAAATRGVGITLAPALAIEAVSQWRADGRALRARLAGSTLVALGPIAYAAGWLVTAGRPLQPWRAESGLGRGFSFPLVSLARGIRVAIADILARDRLISAVELLFTALAVLLLLVGWRSMRGCYRAYVSLGLLIPLAFPFVAPPLASLPRFVIVLFPLFWVAAEKIRKTEWFATTALVSGLGYVTLAVYFMNWRFVA